MEKLRQGEDGAWRWRCMRCGVWRRHGILMEKERGSDGRAPLWCVFCAQRAALRQVATQHPTRLFALKQRLFLMLQEEVEHLLVQSRLWRRQTRIDQDGWRRQRPPPLAMALLSPRVSVGAVSG